MGPPKCGAPGNCPIFPPLSRPCIYIYVYYMHSPTGLPGTSYRLSLQYSRYDDVTIASSSRREKMLYPSDLQVYIQQRGWHSY